MKKTTIAVLAAVTAFSGGPVLAHHSFAMFDLERNMTIQGEVKELQWTNPHVWIQVMVPDAQGRPVEWGLELGTTGMLMRTGWNRNTLKAGDKVTAVIHPLRNGRPSGSLVTIDVPDGRTLGPGGFQPRSTRAAAN